MGFLFLFLRLFISFFSRFRRHFEFFLIALLWILIRRRGELLLFVILGGLYDLGYNRLFGWLL